MSVRKTYTLKADRTSRYDNVGDNLIAPLF